MKIVLTATPEVELAGKYNKLAVSYSSDGKDSTKRLVSFGDGKKAYDVLKEAMVGDAFDVSLKKHGQYWNWVDAKKMDSSEELPPSRPRRNYEGDAERQVSIIKQSCLKCAAEFHSGLAGKENDDAVLATAEVFYKWVTMPLVPANTGTSLVEEVV